MVKLFRRKARIDKERRERALNNEQTLAAQAALKGRVDKLLAKSGGKGGQSRS